jgi:Putative prokaryotic signal transducing protein
MIGLKWEKLTETNGRMEADILKSYLEAEGIHVELFQEAVGHHIYPVMIDGLGRVQIFVSKDQIAVAKELLSEYKE